MRPPAPNETPAPAPVSYTHLDVYKRQVWDMAEFFVIRGYRRRGIGTEVAHEVWRQFPGRWEVRVMQSNHAAYPFWEHAIAAFTGEAIHSVRVENGGNCWHLFSFESRRIT